MSTDTLHRWGTPRLSHSEDTEPYVLMLHERYADLLWQMEQRKGEPLTMEWIQDHYFLAIQATLLGRELSGRAGYSPDQWQFYTRDYLNFDGGNLTAL